MDATLPIIRSRARSRNITLIVGDVMQMAAGAWILVAFLMGGTRLGIILWALVFMRCCAFARLTCRVSCKQKHEQLELLSCVPLVLIPMRPSVADVFVVPEKTHSHAEHHTKLLSPLLPQKVKRSEHMRTHRATTNLVKFPSVKYI